MPAAQHRRKAVAVAVAVVGVAGLSVASAAELTMATAPGVPAAVQTTGVCQDLPLSASFAQEPGVDAAAVTLAGFAQACAGQAYRVQVLDGTGAPLADVEGALTGVPVEDVVVDVAAGAGDVARIVVTLS